MLVRIPPEERRSDAVLDPEYLPGYEPPIGGPPAGPRPPERSLACPERDPKRPGLPPQQTPAAADGSTGPVERRPPRVVLENGGDHVQTS